MSPTATILNDQSSIHHTLDPESKITLGNLSPGRLSPNLFLGINLDHIGMDKNTLSMEWANFTPSTSSTGMISTVQHHDAMMRSAVSDNIDIEPVNCLNLDNASTSSYDDIKFLSSEQFNMDQFKTECILNLDQAMLDDPPSRHQTPAHHEQMMHLNQHHHQQHQHQQHHHQHQQQQLLHKLEDDHSQQLQLHQLQQESQIIHRSQQHHHHSSIDSELQSFSLHESGMDKSSPLMDLEKPIMNISIVGTDNY